MTRRIVFAGGTQARALAKAYRLDIAADRDEDVFFIGTEAMVREAAHRVVAAADIVVTDLSPQGQTVPEHLIPRSAERIAVPVVTAPFLWPYAGRPHPRNRGTDALKDGPYPADFGDRFLDGLMAEGADEDSAVARYLAFDIGRTARLDELLERSLTGLAALDARSGFSLAGFVEQHFRGENLFATTERLRLPLFRTIAGAVFGHIGVAPERVAALTETHFAPGAMPIHPGVLRHFGMTSPAPDHRYPVLDEGMFGFEQYCRRYIGYVWNERLHIAMAMAESDPALAVPLLRAALDVSPGSRAGQLALEEAERALAESTGSAPPVLALGSSAVAGHAPIYAAVDAPLPDDEATSGLMPGSLPAIAAPVASGGEREAEFAPSGLGRLPFTSEAEARERQGGGVSDLALPDERADEPGGQQAYVELGFHGAEVSAPAAPAAAKTRYEPLPPSEALIEVLPRMLPSTRGLTSAADAAFSAMPETMPPPPLRPVLPPELRSDFEEKRGLVARLFGGRR